jgi:N6-L-threonylcarbamoyladenine synthase
VIILGIDTSCDDTCASVLEAKGKKINILSHIISSQVKLHAEYGGVFPSLAKREHLKNLPLVLKQALKEAKRKLNGSDVDYIAVTQGPGLEPCLWTGINFVNELSQKIKKPILPINHIEGHVLANWLSYRESEIKLPAVCLIVSGGHTELVLMKKMGEYKLIGQTRDDAAGECFDKIARILGLGYPGGPIVSAKAEEFKKSKIKSEIKLPRPMINQKNYEFSFSGLKTAVLYKVKSDGILPRQGSDGRRKIQAEKYIQEMCAEAQQSIIDVLVKKTLQAAKDFKAKSIIVGGGVISNKELREQLSVKIKKELPEVKYFIPDIKYCMDNGSMIAMAGFYNLKSKKNQTLKTITADANLKISTP